MAFARPLIAITLLLLSAPPAVRAACFGGTPNGTVDAGEACDDGNTSQTDACLNDCTNAFCGDTHVRAGFEACDDGNANNCDGCRNDCQGTVTGCGDGFVCPPETCDPPVTMSGAANCSSTCTVAVCGDGAVQTPQEECDDGLGNSDTAPDACRTNCRNASCGDGTVDTGETCDDGLDSGTAGVRDPLDDLDNCPNGPTTLGLGTACDVANVCGDGLRHQEDSSPRCAGSCAGALEGCDNGNGATMTCRGTTTQLCTTDTDCGLNGFCGNSDTEPDACRTSCAAPSCGDDVRDTPEACDEGAAECTSDGASNGQECSTTAGATACTSDGGTCNDAAGPDAGASCTVPTNCNSDTVANACRSNCAGPSCGDGIIDAGEECDNGSNNGVSRNCTNTCQNAVCGDAKRDTEAPGIETCDDGNGSDTDNCRTDCTLPVCGDGIIRSTAKNCNNDATKPCTTDAQCTGGAKCFLEECDDSNTTSADGCDSNCRVTGCGSGVVTGSEVCDDGNTANGDGCDSNCQPTGCGNGIVTGMELCDDDNTANFDGCSADCCAERPNAANRTAQFDAMSCLRTALKTEINALADVSPARRARMVRHVDRAGAREARAKPAAGPGACGALRSAGRRIRSVQRLLDTEAGRGNVPGAEHILLGAKIVLLTGWYSEVQTGDTCP